MVLLVYWIFFVGCLILIWFRLFLDAHRDPSDGGNNVVGGPNLLEVVVVVGLLVMEVTRKLAKELLDMLLPLLYLFCCEAMLLLMSINKIVIRLALIIKFRVFRDPYSLFCICTYFVFAFVVSEKIPNLQQKIQSIHHELLQMAYANQAFSAAFY